MARQVGLRQPVLGYYDVHRALILTQGPASSYLCEEDCGRRAYDWSYDHTAEVEYLSLENRPYDPFTYFVTYQPRCRSCHSKLDRTLEQMREDGKRLRGVVLTAEQLSQRGRKAAASRSLEDLEKFTQVGTEALAQVNSEVTPEQKSERARKNPSGNAGGLAASKIRRRCSCGLTSTPAGVGVHQRSSGHQGHEDIPQGDSQ